MIIRGYAKKNSLVVIKHVIESVIEFIRHLLDLELLTVDLIFNVVNPVVELGDVHLSVFIASLSNLESVHKLVNFVLELLFTFLGLLSGDLKLLHVLTNSFQFLFNIPQLPSANSARSLALLSSSSCTPNFLVNSSSFC